MSTEQAAPALKEIFNSERLLHIAHEMRAVYPDFDSAGFISRTHQGLDELSIMQRLARVSESLHAVLPLSYKQSLKLLRKLAPRLNSAFVSMCLPHYVASYGSEDFELSMDALKYFTAFGSSEFAIRHFLLNDFERTLAVMKTWSQDPDEHVRRLASEGSRPRLPWSFRLAQIQADPSLAAERLFCIWRKPDPVSPGCHLQQIPGKLGRTSIHGKARRIRWCNPVLSNVQSMRCWHGYRRISTWPAPWAWANPTGLSTRSTSASGNCRSVG